MNVIAAEPAIEPANANWPIVELHATGDGAALARVLVRVLVRRALIAEGVLRGEHEGARTCSLGEVADRPTLRSMLV